MPDPKPWTIEDELQKAATCSLKAYHRALWGAIVGNGAALAEDLGNVEYLHRLLHDSIEREVVVARLHMIDCAAEDLAMGKRDKYIAAARRYYVATDACVRRKLAEIRAIAKQL